MEKVLSVKDLKKYFPINKSIFNKNNTSVKAVDGISFDLYKNETLGLVGESGSGKSTAGRSILRLTTPTSGSIQFKNEELTMISNSKFKNIRANIQMIFQDPYASLNPRMTIGASIVEPMLAHKLCTRKQAIERAMDLLEKTGLNKEYFYRFPHEFSGGQRQRIGIARALGLNPEIIIADEPVSALDVSVQAQIINLFKDLQKEFSLSYIFIAHDLSVVEYLSDRIAVMYLGEIVELADKKELFENPMHPYTQALISAIPIPDPTRRGKKMILEGDIPSNTNPPVGCKFSTRCPKCMDICKKVKPSVMDFNGHRVQCHIYTKDVKKNG